MDVYFIEMDLPRGVMGDEDRATFSDLVQQSSLELRYSWKSSSSCSQLFVLLIEESGYYLSSNDQESGYYLSSDIDCIIVKKMKHLILKVCPSIYKTYRVGMIDRYIFPSISFMISSLINKIFSWQRFWGRTKITGSSNHNSACGLLQSFWARIWSANGN